MRFFCVTPSTTSWSPSPEGRNHTNPFPPPRACAILPPWGSAASPEGGVVHHTKEMRLLFLLQMNFITFHRIAQVFFYVKQKFFCNDKSLVIARKENTKRFIVCIFLTWQSRFQYVSGSAGPLFY